MIGIYHGPRKDLYELFGSVLGGKVEPRFQQIEEGPTAKFLSTDFAFDTIPTIKYTAKRGVVNKPMSREAAELIIHWIGQWPGSDHPEGGGVALFTLGGQINQVRPEDTAFFHRKGLFLFNIDASFKSDAYQSAVEEWARHFYDDMKQHNHVSEYCYQGFPDRELLDWPNAYYGTNYPRLQGIKRTYDPDNFFEYEQSIVPATPVDRRTV